MSRVEFNRATRRAIIERAAGRCEKCSATLKPSEGEVDHILPCSLGGKAEIANGWLLCRVCHKAKSATDIARTRKADRQRDRASGALKAKTKIRSAGFPKRRARTPKPSLPATNGPLYRLWAVGQNSDGD